MPTFLEFFCGGGMVRAGLGPGWNCLFANDIDAGKGRAYAENWGGEALRVEDIAALEASDLPGHADLAWASFPCQDLSLAGRGEGLDGARSGTFWAFARLMKELKAAGRLPKIIALENVAGLMTARGSADFAAVTGAIATLGYRVGAMAIDAERFVPQSRPRLFIIAARDDLALSPTLLAKAPTAWTTPRALVAACEKFSRELTMRWLWWRLPEPAARNLSFADLIEREPGGGRWHSPAETARLLSLMSEVNRAKVAAAQAESRWRAGTVYRRTRRDENGASRQRAEIRFDGVAGCLRTPGGGSSRQTVMIVEGKKIRSRLLSPREAARLMGLGDDYVLPARDNDAYHLTGDGVVAPVARHLAAHLLEPLLASEAPRLAAE